MSHLVYRDRLHKEGVLSGQTERYWPDADDRGLFELGDPEIKEKSHHKLNAIFVENEAAAIRLVRRYGFSLRMRGEFTGQRNLISAAKIKDAG
jgi:hypothetical protein